MTSSRKNTSRPANEHREWMLVAAILFLALALRAIFLSAFAETSFYSRHFSDSRIYVELAQRLLLGEGGDRAWFMSPLYPWLLAGIEAITGDMLLWTRILQNGFAVVTVYFVWRIGDCIFDRKTGLIAALLTAVSIQLVYHDSLLLIDSLLTLFSTAGLYFLIKAVRQDRRLDWMISGVLFGLAVITRTTFIAFLPVVWIGWMFRAKHGPVHFQGPAIWSASLLLLLLPTAIHNYSAEGIFQPVTSSFGFNLFAGNNETAKGLYHLPEDVDLYADPNGQAFAERRMGKRLNSAEVSSYWRDRALHWIAENPGEFFTLYLRKIVLMFHPSEIDQIGLSMEFFEQRFGRIPALPMVAFPVMLLLAFAGFFASIGSQGPKWPVNVLFFSIVLSTAVFFVSGRLRLPLLPIIYLYAAAGISALLASVKRKPAGRTVGLFALGIVVGIALLLVQPEVDQRFEQEYLKLGQISFDNGAYAESEQLFVRSLQERSTLDGHINLGNARAAQGRFSEASVAYREALDMDSTSALAWFNYGNMWMQRGDAPRAHLCWTRAVQHNPRLPAARKNLGILLAQAGRLREAEEQFVMYLSLERDSEARAIVQRDLDSVRKLLRSLP